MPANPDMKNCLLTASLWLLLTAHCSLVFGQVPTNHPTATNLTLQVDTNGNLLNPTNFFHQNSARLNADVHLLLQFFNTVYVSKNGNDSTGLRNRADLPFLTMTAAKAAALPGDTGIVFPGLYAENNLLKSGVNWSFWPGVTISNNPAANDTNGYGIFDDRTSGATTNYIYGRPNLYYSTGTVSNSQAISNTCTVINPPDNPGGAIEYFYQITNSMGAIVTTNPATVLVAELGDLTYYSTSQNTPLIPAAINIKNCSYVSVDVNRILNAISTNAGYVNTGDSNFSCFSLWLPVYTDPQNATGIYWNAGETHINCRYLDYFSTGIWCNETVTNTTEQDFYYTGDVVHSKIYQSGITTNFVGWYDVKLIDTTGYGNHYLPTTVAVSLFGGKEYLRAEKVSSYSGSDIAFDPGSTNQAWVTVQKLQMPTSNNSTFVTVNSGAKTNKFTLAVNEYEDVGGSATGIQNSAGNLSLQGGRMVLKNGVGISHSGGATTVDGLTVDTSAGTGTNKWPALVSAAGLKLKNATLNSPASTFTEYAAASTSVGNYNVATNNPAHPNIIAETSPLWNGFDYLQVRYPQSWTSATNATNVTAKITTNIVTYLIQTNGSGTVYITNAVTANSTITLDTANSSDDVALVSIAVTGSGAVVSGSGTKIFDVVWPQGHARAPRAIRITYLGMSAGTPTSTTLQADTLNFFSYGSLSTNGYTILNNCTTSWTPGASGKTYNFMLEAVY